MKRNSLVMKWAFMGKPYTREQMKTVDICTLMRKLIANTFFVGLTIIMIAFVGFVLLSALTVLAELFLNMFSPGWMFYFGEFSIGATIVTFMMSIIAGVVILSEWLEKRHENREHMLVEPSIINAGFKRWKDKVCHIYTLED